MDYFKIANAQKATLTYPYIDYHGYPEWNGEEKDFTIVDGAFWLHLIPGLDLKLSDIYQLSETDIRRANEFFRNLKNKDEFND